jgi:uncharacterized protein (UPF0332 family)
VKYAATASICDAGGARTSRQARACLARAQIIFNAGVGEDAGRNAYLAGFHAAQAPILVHRESVAKTHRRVHRLFSELAKNEPELAKYARFLSQSYNLTAVADYELGPGAEVPLDRAGTAIDAAAEFVDFIEKRLT